MLGKSEKQELEALILQRLEEHYDKRGSAALLGEGLRVIVSGDGVRLDVAEAGDALGTVPVRELFTALCYLSAGTPTLPREALSPLAAEAASALAAQVNRLFSR